MQRITITLEEDLLEEIDRHMAARGYQNRSEAIRDLARTGLREAVVEAEEGACVAALVYVFDHEKRELAGRLTSAHHHHHDISLATTHVHLDHDTCLEVALLRGMVPEVRHFAEHVIAERGVRHGKLVVVPANDGVEHHSHGEGEEHGHLHVR